MIEPTETELLEASIARVWNERDDEKRLAAIAAIYNPDARIYEPERSITGHEAISNVVAGVLADMPPDFRFDVVGPTLGHHDVAITRWRGGTPAGTMLTGADTVRIVDGKIQEHWFFFDPAN